MLFIENSGTGKTTVARMVAKTLFDLGYIKENKCIEVEYSLTSKNMPEDYGHEAVSTLIKAMEDYKDEIVVIFAGYTKEMKEFVNSNSGIDMEARRKIAIHELGHAIIHYIYQENQI